jgi:geranylgeranyl pyrophosphate synthase
LFNAIGEFLQLKSPLDSIQTPNSSRSSWKFWSYDDTDSFRNAAKAGSFLSSHTIDHCAIPPYIQTYLTKTYYKTASLLANSCKSVALLGEHDEQMQEIAFEYGKSIGLAFQIVDDILDIVGDGKLVGKDVGGTDLSQGILTAPVLFALEESVEMQEMLARKWSKEGDVARAVQICCEGNGIHRARLLAEHCADNAVAAIMMLNPSVAQSALITLVKHVLTRDR